MSKTLMGTIAEWQGPRERVLLCLSATPRSADELAEIHARLLGGPVHPTTAASVCGELVRKGLAAKVPTPAGVFRMSEYVITAAGEQYADEMYEGWASHE